MRSPVANFRMSRNARYARSVLIPEDAACMATSRAIWQHADL